MELNLYNKEGQLKATVSPADSSTLTEGLMTDYILSLSFVLFDCVPLDVNDYVDFLGKRYWMLEAYTPNQKSTIEWNYSVKFYGIESVIRRALCLFMVDNELNPVFSLTDSAIEHVRLVVQNINRVMGTTDWKVGEVEATANLTIDYNGTYCDAALSSIATAADTEWWIDGLTVNLCRCEYGELLSLGYENGLREITLDTNENAKFFTRLFPLGSTRNIDASKYGSTRLHLPGDVKYVEQNTHYGVIEHSEEAAFSAIYPRRVGKVGTVRHETKKGEDGKDFDIYYFTDPEIDFDPNKYELPNQKKNIVFETGDLAGRDFEVNYNAEKKEFEVITQFPYDDNTQLPGQLVMKPTDEYILYNITMPTEYYARAEQEFATAVAAYMERNKRDKSVYKAPTDYIDLSERGIVLTVGQRVHLMSDKYFPVAGYRDSRISKITRKVNETLQADIEISDLADPGGKATITQGISEAKHYAQAAMAGLPDMIKSWENTPASDSSLYTSKKTDKEIRDRAVSRKYDDSMEGLLTCKGGLKADSILTDLLASENYSSGALGTGMIMKVDSETGKSYLEVDELFVRIKAIFTELVIQKLSHVGGQQILTPASMVCIRVEELESVYRCYFKSTDGEKTIKNEFVVDDQATIREFNIKPGVHQNVSNRYYWRLVTAIGDDYIDLSKTDCDTNSDIPAAGDDICHLGNRSDESRQGALILSSYGDNSPSIKLYKGISSYKLPKPIIDLNPETSIITAKLISEATGKDVDDSLKEIVRDVTNIKEQSDKSFTIWMEEYMPTLENEPASLWLDDVTREEHEQDIFYNTSAIVGESGRAFRYEKSEDGTYSWDEITDRDTLAALEQALAADKKADSKKRVFVDTPDSSSVYDKGDLWVNAVYNDGTTIYKNDSLVCITAKEDGDEFSISHWKPSSAATTAYLENLGDQIVLAVTDSKEGIEAAKKLAEQGISDAKSALGIANDANDAAAKNTAAIVVTNKSIASLVQKIHIDSDGNITNIKTSGLLTTAEFNTLFTQQVAADGLVKRADISTFITEDDAGELISNATIQADKINFTGKTIINGNFIVNPDGSMSVKNMSVTEGSNIAGLKISGNTLTNEGFNNDACIILRNDPKKSFAGIGAELLPATLGGIQAVARFENGRSISDTDNIAMYCAASGANGRGNNYAIMVGAGKVWMPGVLFAGIVQWPRSDGDIVTHKKYNWEHVTRVFSQSGAAGYLQIEHDLGHTNYIVITSIYGEYTLFSSSWDYQNNLFKMRPCGRDGSVMWDKPICFAVIGMNTK